MQRDYLVFTAPRELEVRNESLPALEPGQVHVQTLLSAISPGTELLVYKGEFPEDLPIDDSIQALAGKFKYPLKYGYAVVGRVVETGAEVNSEWLGKLVFAFQPHASYFNTYPEGVHLIPKDISLEDAVFLPNMETAVNLVLDGTPVIGEQVVIFGQGIIGLLTTTLLSRFPLSHLITLDRYPRRRQASNQSGAHLSLDPTETEDLEAALASMPGSQPYPGADLVYELSGAPQALDHAIDITGFNGRIVIGSWYGSKRAALDLGGRFHRARIRLISSQVSTLAPKFGGRWTKARRLQVAWNALREVQPSRFITQRFPLDQAPQAYQLLDQNPEESIQIVFTYPPLSLSP